MRLRTRGNPPIRTATHERTCHGFTGCTAGQTSPVGARLPTTATQCSPMSMATRVAPPDSALPAIVRAQSARLHRLHAGGLGAAPTVVLCSSREGLTRPHAYLLSTLRAPGSELTVTRLGQLSEYRA